MNTDFLNSLKNSANFYIGLDIIGIATFKTYS